MKKTLLIFAIFAVACAGNSPKERQRDFRLTAPDSVFIDRTVAVYDAFVRSRVDSELPTGEAYKRFFAETGAKVESAGDMGLFMPDSAYVYEWTYNLIGSARKYNSLVELTYISPLDPNLSIDGVTLPGGWQFGLRYPNFFEFARKLGETNAFWAGFADSAEAARDFSPTCYVALIRMNHEIDFDNRHERFMAVLPFMNRCFDHRDFNLVRDAPRNDSLRTTFVYGLQDLSVF